MGRLARDMSDDIGAATLRLRLEKALQEKHKYHETRNRELHVSDFTKGEKQWCTKELVWKYYYRSAIDQYATWVRFDGKWREEKWLQLFQTEMNGRPPMLVSYQKTIKMRKVQGHPDFIIRMGKTLHVVELTGHNSGISEGLRHIRTAIKVNQCRLYTIMLAYMLRRRDIVGDGYVIVEDKGANTFTITPVPWSATAATRLLNRVKDVERWIRIMDEIPEEKRPAGILKTVPGCGRCSVCKGAA